MEASSFSVSRLGLHTSMRYLNPQVRLDHANNYGRMTIHCDQWRNKSSNTSQLSVGSNGKARIFYGFCGGLLGFCLSGGSALGRKKVSLANSWPIRANRYRRISVSFVGQHSLAGSLTFFQPNETALDKSGLANQPKMLEPNLDQVILLLGEGKSS